MIFLSLVTETFRRPVSLKRDQVMNISRAIIALATIGAAALSGTAHAATAVNGDTITCTSAPFNCYAPTATVGAGPEFNYGIQGQIDLLRFDFSQNLLSIVFPLSGSVGFGGPQSISFRDLTNAFTSATLLSNSSSSQFNQSKISLVNGLLTLDFGSMNVSGNGAIQIALDGGATGAVPEPATWAMMLMGFGAMGYAMRRPRKVAARIRFA